MISRANLNNTLELRNVCMYSLSFVGLLQLHFDDLIRIKRCDLSFSSDHLAIVIAKSKNDQLRKGNEVLISETASPTSSIKLLQLYLSRVQLPSDCDKYILRPMVKSRSHHSLVKDNRHISYTTFRNSLKSDLDGVVEDPNMYSSHSLRAGGATKAASYRDMDARNQCRLTTCTLMIALLTSWKFLNRYKNKSNVSTSLAQTLFSNYCSVFPTAGSRPNLK